MVVLAEYSGFCTSSRLIRFLSLSKEELAKVLSAMESQGRIEMGRTNRGRLWVRVK